MVCDRYTNDYTLIGILTSSITAPTLLDLPPTAPLAPPSVNASLRTVKDINNQVWEANASLGITTEDKDTNQGLQLTMGDDGVSSVDIYENFISAVLAMVSYNLAYYHNYLPLNSRTFLSPAAAMSILPNWSDLNQSSEPRGGSTLVTLDVRLTDMGTLIVTSSVVSSKISRLRPSSWDDDSWLQAAELELSLSPGGQTAKHIGPAVSSTDIMLAESAPSSERPYVDVPLREMLLIDTWKVRVKAWLVGKGIHLADTTPRDWVKVLTTSSRAPTAGNGGLSQKDGSHELQFLWPRELCYTRVIAYSDRLYASDNCLQISEVDAGSYDPLSFAEDWFKSKLLRHEQLEAARSARQADEALAQHSRVSETMLLENNAMDEPYIRVVNYLDLHAAGTIYPTPPDGTHTQGSTGAHISNEIGSTPDNGDVGNCDQSASVGANQEHGLTTATQIDEGLSESGERRRSDASQIAMLSAAYDASNVDMFGDMDGDMFGTSGITEADFSFFDQPDMEDAGDEISGPADHASLADASSRINSVSQSTPQNMAGDFPIHSCRDSRSHDIHSGHTNSIAIDNNAQNADDMHYQHLLDPEAPMSVQAGIDPYQGTPLIRSGADEGTGGVGDNDFLSPPLSPVSVRQRILPKLENSLVTLAGPQPAVPDGVSKHCTTDTSSQESGFGRVKFARAVDFSDGKYRDDGRFSSHLQGGVSHQESRSLTSDIPSIGLPTARRKDSRVNTVRRISNTSVPSEDTALDSDVVSELDGGDSEDAFETQVSPTANTDSMDLGEDTSVGVKRKRDSSHGDNAPAEVPSTQTTKQPPPDESEAGYQLPSLSRFDPSASAWPLPRSEPQSGKYKRKAVGLSDDDYIRVAQILTDQVVSSSLGCYGHVNTLNSGTAEPPMVFAGKEVQSAVGKVIRSIFPTSSLCDLETYAAIKETTWESPTNVRALNKHSRWAKTGGDGSGGLESHISRLNAPHIRVQRAETPLEVLSPSVPFWETLGFGPVNGTKDVRAFCICPPMQGLEDAADSFLKGLGSAYESCKLGSHTRGDYPKSPRPGLVPIVGGEATPSLENTVNQIIVACEEFGKTPLMWCGSN